MYADSLLLILIHIREVPMHGKKIRQLYVKLVRRFLFLRQLKYHGRGKALIFGEMEDALLLPRGNLGYIQKLLNDCNMPYEITDEREQGKIIEFDFTAELYTEQKEALQAMLKSDIGILSAGTGFGKTVTAAALIAERKKNTIILVQTHTLLEQWKKAIKQFLNYEAGTIATGKDTSTGIIDIAIIKSLTEKNSDAVKLRRHIYGMLIVDECHHVSAFGTENLVKSFRAKYVYGLTATPVRRDGRQKIIFMQCGQILYATTAKQMNRVQNFEHYFIPRFTSFHIAADNQANTQPSIQNYYSEMVKAEARNILIMSDVKTAVKEGRTPLVLSDRIESLFSAAKIARLKNTASLLIANIAY